MGINSSFKGLKKWDREARVDWSGSEQGQVVGSCKCDNETESFVQRGKFPDWLRKCQLLKEDCSTELVSLCRRVKYE
jgi:hypothetical protein